jgi:predicted peptidase
MPVIDQHYNIGLATMGYKLFLPEHYGNLTAEAFPLLLFLHGIKRRGSDLRRLDGYGLLGIAERREHFPYVLVVPQCPEGAFWPENRDLVLGVLEQVAHTYRVDRSRMYLTGFSMGGNGVWDLAANTEGVFAAAAPLAGWYDPNAAARLRSTPIWAFHGEDDDTVPIDGSVEMIQAIAEAGGTPKFTKLPNRDHAIMDVTYERPELWEWFLMHTARKE